MKQAIKDFVASFYSLDSLSFEEVTLDGDTSPRYMTKQMPLLPAGKFVHPLWGELNFDDTVLKSAVRNFEKKVAGVDIALDERHDHGRATGWVKDVRFGKKKIGEKEFQGLFGDVEWTPHGRQLLENKIYKYFSAEFGTYVSADGKQEVKNVLLGGGLTNRPFFKMMGAIEFEDGGAKDVLRFGEDPSEEDKHWEFISPEEVDSFSDGFDPRKQPIVKDKIVTFEEMLAEFNKQFSLDIKDKAGLEALLKSGTANTSALSKIRETLKSNGLQFSDDTDLATVVSTVLTTQKSQIDSLSTQVQGISAKFEDQEAKAAVQNLVRQGKIVPAQVAEFEQLYKADQKLFESMTGKLVKVVEFGERGGIGIVPEPGQAAEFEDDDKAAEKGRDYLKLIGVKPKSAV